jgi:hypothetical protein
MAKQPSSNAPLVQPAGPFLRNVILKTILLLAIISFGFAWVDPIQSLGRISLYNHLFPGRLRLPFGEDFEKSYNISILQLEAMFASHEINDFDKTTDEFRVLLLGDSSVWGFLLSPDDTLSATLNDQGLKAPDGRILRFYNLGYPTMSVMKDLVLLDFAQRYQPDLILWFVTLESLPVQKQLESPLVQYNPETSQSLMDRFHLEIDASDERFILRSFWDQTLIGQRRDVADLIRLQLLGAMWAGTHIDHDVPSSYEPAPIELTTETSFQGYQPGKLSSAELAFDILEAGVHFAGDTTLIFINQPILIATGSNSDIRYNAYYPRWAYDAYREMMDRRASEQGWTYLDLWDVVPAEWFTDNAIHYSPQGVGQVVNRLSDSMMRIVNQTP